MGTNKISLIKLLAIFIKIGAILLGGGYVILPILKNEFVDNNRLIADNELVDFYAISQSLPGLIAINISLFIGYKLRGKIGALIALLGIIIVPFFTILCLAGTLSLLMSNVYVNALLWGVSVAATALIVLTIREVWQKSNRDNYFYTIFGIALLCSLIFKPSPIMLILIICFIGLAIKFIQKRRKK